MLHAAGIWYGIWYTLVCKMQMQMQQAAGVTRMMDTTHYAYLCVHIFHHLCNNIFIVYPTKEVVKLRR